MQDDSSTPPDSNPPSVPPQGPDPGAALPGQAPVEGGFLGLVERLGNLLPDPVTLFVVGTVVVMALSAIAVGNDWAVTKMLPEVVTQVDATGVETTVLDEQGRPTTEWRVQYAQNGEPEQLVARSLLTGDGLFWTLQNMVKNFINFAPLGVVLVGMLGIGVAERVGLIAALLKAFMMVVPRALLTPAMVFLGVMSSAGIDAGYVVLPPLAAALYKAAGRAPLAGLAAVFAGVAAGFNANLMVTGLDPMLAGFATTGAQVIDPDYAVNPACNLYFMIASTFVITLVGWWVTARFVEPRLEGKSPEEGGPSAISAEDLESQRIQEREGAALKIAAALLAGLVGLFLVAYYNPGWALHGEGALFARWAEAIVPMLFLLFLVPSIGFGVVMGKIKGDKGLAKLFVDSIAAMAPIIVLAFFAAQFIEYFKYSGLDKMLALWGGQTLGQIDMPSWMLVVSFIGITMVFNLFIGSMSAKYALFAPIFIPMFMLVGISPELTQAAYRIGDSVTNSITPLNPYVIVILVFMQRFVPKGGLGTLISTMLPYSIAFAVVWTIMIVGWIVFGFDLGVDGGLQYDVTGLSAK